MNKYLKGWIGTIIFLAVIGQNGSVQSQSDGSSAFESFKMNMISAAKESNQLMVENRGLKAQLESLQLEIERYGKEEGGLDQIYADIEASKNKQNELVINWKGIKDDPLVREAQELYLNGRRIGLDEAQRLRELQLYDLQYQKQELMLDLTFKKISYQEEKEKRRREMDTLQRDIQANEAKENNLLLRIAEIKKEVGNSSYEIDLLKMQIKSLKQSKSNLKQILLK